MFTVGSPNTTQTSFVISPTTGIVANNSASSVLTVTVRDSLAHPISGQSVSIATSGSGDTLSPASGTSNASGVFTSSIVSTVAQTKTLTATAGTASESGTVTFVPGAADFNHSVFTVTPSTTTAGRPNGRQCDYHLEVSSAEGPDDVLTAGPTQLAALQTPLTGQTFARRDSKSLFAPQPDSAVTKDAILDETRTIVARRNQLALAAHGYTSLAPRETLPARRWTGFTHGRPIETCQNAASNLHLRLLMCGRDPPLRRLQQKMTAAHLTTRANHAHHASVCRRWSR